jgi:wyosine [tRNA(Phe)-imidazoG37] synthetase (radical SAM superfamily)
LGRTRNKTVTRQEYVPIHQVLPELEDWLKTGGKADYITLSGSGEPTLHSRFQDVIRFIHKNSKIPAVLLTNGTMLHTPEVREAASQADVVKVSLSAWDEASYEWVNRPHPKLAFDQLVEGQKLFRKQFKGALWMEVFLVWGINSTPDDVRKIAALAKEIGPDRVHLNTAVRPPAEAFAEPLSKERMAQLAYLFQPPAEVISEFRAIKRSKIHINKEMILSMLQRRPCTADHIAQAFGMHLNEVSKYLGNLLHSDQIRAERKNKTVYYIPVSKDEQDVAHV